MESEIAKVRSSIGNFDSELRVPNSRIFHMWESDISRDNNNNRERKRQQSAPKNEIGDPERVLERVLRTWESGNQPVGTVITYRQNKQKQTTL